MSVLVDLRNYLLAQTDITNIVGQRIAQEYMSERDPLPFLLFGRRGLEQIGLSVDPGCGGPDRHDIDIEARAKTLDEAENLMFATRVALHDFRGTMGSTLVVESTITTVSDDYIFLAEAGEFEHINALSLQMFTA